MSLPILLVLLISVGIVLIVVTTWFALYTAKTTTARYKALWELTDGRMTELIAINKTAAELIGRAAERDDQLARERQEKAQSDEHRRIQTTEQADRIVSEQEHREPT